MTSSIDYTSFIYAIAACLTDPSPEVIESATDTLNELAKTNPVAVARTLVTEMSSNRVGVEINRSSCIATIHAIVCTHYSPGLIPVIIPPLFSFASAFPSPPDSLFQASFSVISLCADRNPSSVAAELPAVPTLTLPTLDFLLQRSTRRESPFFVCSDSITPLFQSVLDSITKFTQEKLRLPLCQLLLGVCDILIELFPKGSCCSSAFARLLDVLTKPWFRKPPELQTAILHLVGKLACAIGGAHLFANADRLCAFLADSVGKAGLKFAAVAGLAQALQQVEALASVPKVPAAALIAKLVDFVEGEYASAQTDGAAMRAVNLAVGGLGSLMAVFPTAPLDAILRRLPSPAAFYALDVFCQSFAQSEFALAIARGLASARFAAFAPPQKQCYVGCFRTLLKQCAVATPDFADIFRNAIAFVAAGADEETAASFVALVEQNTHVFPLLSPAVFQCLLNPAFLNAVPTLVAIAGGLRPHIARTLRQLGQANVDLVAVVAILLVFYFADMFKADVRRRIARVVAALLGIADAGEDLVGAVLERRKADGWAAKLLDAARQHVVHFVNCGGEKPVLPPQSRAVLRGAVAQLVGQLARAPEIAQQLETLHGEVLARFDPESFVESQGVARFIGLEAAANAEFVAAFLAAEMDTLAVNQQQRFKFWKKKGKTFLSAQAAVLTTAFVLDGAPDGCPQVGNLFKACVSNFLKDDDLPQRCKLQLMRSAFARAVRDPTLDVPDGGGFVRHAIGILKTFNDVFEHDDAVQVLVAAFRSAPSLIPAPEQLLTDVLDIIRIKLSGSELIRLFGSVSELLEVIIRKKQLSSPDLLSTFHQTCLRYVKVPRLALPFLEAVRRILGAHESLTDSNPIRILQIASTYVIISFVPPYTELAREVSLGLLTRLFPGEYDISTLPAAAEALFAFDIAGIQQAMLNVPLLVGQDAGAFALAADSLFLEFAATKYARQAPAELAHLYLQVPARVGPPLLKLFLEVDSLAVVNRLLLEPLDAKLASVFSAFLSSDRERNTALHHLLYCDRAVLETSLLILRDGAVPFEGNAEEIYVRLAILILRLQQPELTHVICDVLAKHVANAAAFEATGSARESLLVSTDYFGIRLIFDDLAPRATTNHAKLLELAKAVVADGTIESAVVSAVVCGKVLAAAQSPAVARDVVDLLVGEPRGEAVAAERLRALGELALAAPEARASESVRVINFLIGSGRSVLALSSLARVVPAAGDDSLFAVSEGLLALLQAILEAGAETLLAPALRILAVAAGSRRLATYSRATETFTALFPLVVAASFGFERDAAAAPMLAICRRIGVPPLVPADRAHDFVDANIGVLVKALRDVDAFVTQLAKARARQNPRVRAGVCYLLAALLARDQRRLGSRKVELVNAVVEGMAADVESVRIGAARAFGVLVE